MAEIGKVSVRVTPDTRGFAAETRRKLKALKDPKFKVNAELNTDYFNAQLKKFLAETNKEMLESRNRITIRTQLHVHKRDMQDDVRHIRDQYQSFADKESIEFQHHLAKSVSRNGDISDNVLGLDAKQFVRDLSRALRSQDFVADVDIRSREGIRGLKRRLERENIEVEAHVKVDARKALKDINTFRGVMAEALRTNYDLGKIEVDLGNQSEEFMKSVRALEELRPLVTATAKEQDRLAQSFYAVERIAEQARRKLAAYERDLNSFVEAREKAVQKERDATEELAEIRRQMNADPSKRNELIDREHSLVRRIAQIREQIHENAWESANEEVRLNERILRTRKLIERSTKDMARLSERGLDLDIKSQPSRKMVESLRSQVDEAAKEIETQHIDFEARLDEFSAESVRARLAEIARDRVSTVWVNIRARDIDHLRGFWARGEQSAQRIGNSMARYATQMVGLRLMWNTMKDLLDILPKLDMAVPQVAAWTAGITAGVSSLSWLIGSLLNIGGDVLKIANLALMAPSMITGAAGAFAILYRSFMDFREVLPDVVSDWEDLGRVVSSKVWSQAEAPIRHLHETLKPLINLKVPEWAEALGGALGGVARGIEGGFASGHLEEFLDNSVEGTEAATNGLEMLASALTKLVGVGSRFFPKIGEWFTDTMTDFDSWVTRNDQNGNLERWVDEGVQSLADLGRAFWNFGGILRQLGIGADQAGMPGLDKFADGLERLNQAMKSDEFMQEYTMGMTRFAGFMENITDLGPQFSETLSTIWDIFSRGAEILGEPIGGFLEAVMNGINDPEFGQHMLEGLGNFGEFIEAISPGIEDLTREFGALFQIVSVAAKEWGPAFNGILELFSDLGSTLHPAMQDFLEATGPKLQELIEDLRQPALDAADALGDLLSNEDFQAFVGDLLSGLGDVVGFLADVATWGLEAASAFSTWYENNIPDWLKDFVAQTIAWSAVGGVFLGIIGKLWKALAPLRLVLGGIWRVLFGKKGSGGWLRPLLDRLKNFKWSKIGDGIKGLGTKLANFFKNIRLPSLGGLASRIAGFFTGLGPKLSELLKGGASKAGGIVGAISKWFSGLFSKIKPGKLLSGLKSILPGGLKGLLKKALPMILKIGTGPIGWITLIGSLLNGINALDAMDFVDGILEALGLDDTLVGRIWDGMRERVADIFGPDAGLADLLSPIFNTFSKAWNGMKEGWSEDGLWGAIKGFFGGFADGITDHLELGLDMLATTMTNLETIAANWNPTSSTGKFIKGLIERIPGLLGFEDGSWSFSTLTSSWGDLFGDIWSNHIEPWLTDGWNSLVDAVTSWAPVKAVIDFFNAPLETIWGWLTGGGGEITALSSDAGSGSSSSFASIAGGEGGGSWGSGVWSNHIQPWLTDGWNALKQAILDWKPVKMLTGFFSDPWGTIKKLLGIAGDFIGNIKADLVEWGTGLWEEKVKPWLDDSWENLKSFITNWTPIGLAIKIGSMIIDWVKDLIGWDDASFDFDFTELWEDKIKPALKTGLGVLIGIIAAPGLVLAAPLALGGLVIKWLFGDNPFEGISGKVSSLLEGAGPKLKEGLTTGLGKLRSAIPGYGAAESAGKKAGGWLAGVLGVDKKGQEQTGKGLNQTTQKITDFGELSKGPFANLRKVAGDEMNKMRQGAGGSVDGLRKDGVGSLNDLNIKGAKQAQLLQSSVVQRGTKMQLQYVRAMTQLNRQSMAQMRAYAQTARSVMGFSLAPQASRTSSTYRNGLRGGLNGALGIASSIVSQLRGRLGFSAYSSGRSIGSTFASGLRSMIGTVGSAASALARKARGFLPNSPSEEGPFSGSGWGGWGESIGEELAKGLKRAAPEVAREAENLMGGIQTALDQRSTINPGVDVEATRRRGGGLAAGGYREQSAPNVSVNVTSNAEDPLVEGRRLAGDIAYALKGRGY